MFIVLYRWRIKAEFEDQFTDAWSTVTEYFVKNFDSLGSRLHLGDDGIWYAYAQWKSAEQRDNAFFNSEITPVSVRMSGAIEESFPEIKLEIVTDLLK